MVADDTGEMVSEVRYSAFGEIRYDSGTMTTDYLYTGQRQEAEIGLYYYVARWYDPAIGRFIQADSVVPDPGSAKGFDRYSYSYNSPLNYLDPSGHRPIYLDGDQFAETDQSQGITNVISIKARELTNNANNYKPLSKKNENVAFPDKNYDHNKPASADGQKNVLPGFSSNFTNPFGEYSPHKQMVIDGALSEYYGGEDNIHKEANECFVNPSPQECNNPFWSNNPYRVDIGTNSGEYTTILTTQYSSNASNIFFQQLLTVAGASTEEPYQTGNYDPWWLHGLMHNPSLVERAASLTIQVMESSLGEYDPAFVEFIRSLGTAGN